jgi:C-terminal processing protease CtpA/Prc
MKTGKRLGTLALLLAVWVIGVGANCYAGEQAYLGVILQPLTIDLKEAMDVDRDLRGVLISDVVDESPADNYGLEDGDILIEIDGKEISTVSGATRTIKAYSPGDEVKIVVLRDGDKKEIIEVRLGEREEYRAEKRHYDYDFDYDFDFEMPDIKGKFIRAWGDHAYLGVRIQDLSSDLGDYFGVGEGEGVLVLEVLDDSPAEDEGLKPGDVILKIDGEEIEDTDDLVEYISEQEPGDEVEITYKRKRRTRTVEVELGEKEMTSEDIGEWFDESGMHRIRIKTEPGEKCFKTYKVPGKRGDIRVITIPDKDAILEDLEDIHIDIDEIDMEHLRKEMEDLKKELQELKKELQKLKE